MRYLKDGLVILVAGILLVYLGLWGLSLPTYPVDFGISFNQDHAMSLGLDWKKTYLDMLDDLQPKYLRIAAMWSDVEWVQGKFEFDKVDFMMDEAAKRGVKVMLVVGQKTPRWPECHLPAWYQTQASTEKEKYLHRYVQKTVERYRNHPALEIWQVENEPFIEFAFGDCVGYDQSLVASEIALVKSLDPDHATLVTDSGELSTWSRSIDAADLFGTTLYRVVYTPGGYYFDYDWLPAGYYHAKAAFFGKEMSQVYVAELQAEPWFTNGNPQTASVAEQEESMNPERLQKHLEYVTHIGAPRAYLWGVEWWAFMKEKRGDSRYWDLIRNELRLDR